GRASAAGSCRPSAPRPGRGRLVEREAPDLRGPRLHRRSPPRSMRRPLQRRECESSRPLDQYLESWQMYSKGSPPEIHFEAVVSVIVNRLDQGFVYAPGSSMVTS